MQPEVFFLLFLPPLLFLDGWRIPKEDLLRDKGTIIELALGLVLFTVIGVGFFIHWMIPSMPMAVAFALAAIVSPTDPIAVPAITSRVPIPKRLMHILEEESLLNDASGLVCMRFAVAAALTGTFSVLEASLTFMWLAAAGIGIGIAVTWVVGRISLALIRRIGEDPSAQILLTVIIPFAAYLMAEHVHASGILAAVAAGITVSYMGASSPAIKAETRIRGVTIRDAIAFTANGAIFIILGAQLPDIASGAVDIVRSTGHHEPVWLVLYALAINIGLVSLRLLWVWISLRFTLYREARRGNAFKAPSWRLIVATSLAGVRGTITLAGILTLPLFMNDGSPFPARDLAIFLAATTIIISLLVASIGLRPTFSRAWSCRPNHPIKSRKIRFGLLRRGAQSRQSISLKTTWTPINPTAISISALPAGSWIFTGNGSSSTSVPATMQPSSCAPTTLNAVWAWSV